MKARKNMLRAIAALVFPIFAFTLNSAAVAVNVEDHISHPLPMNVESAANGNGQEEKPDAAGGQTDLLQAMGLTTDSALPPQPFQLLPAFMPVFASNPGLGFVGGVYGNAGVYYGPLTTTTMSSAGIAAIATSKNQIIFSFMSNIITAGNEWMFIGDWNYSIYNQPTFGLGTGPLSSASGAEITAAGGGTAVGGSQMLDFKMFRVHELIMKRLTAHFYLGAGYGLDVFNQIGDRRLSLGGPAPEITAHYAYSTQYGFDPSQQTISGFSVAALYDTRDSTLNPYRGIYGILQFTQNPVALGSSQASSVIHSEFRAYLPTSAEIARNVLALSICAEGVINGSLPYLALPSTGWGANTGRGYSPGRFRGPWEAYAESEWRFRISDNGLLGGVIFANLQTFSSPAFTSAGYSSPEVRLLQYFQPAIGTGLRILLNSESRANLCVDIGFGRDSADLWVQLGEYF